MSDLSTELRLKHFQLALSMVGVTANLMTCELIQSISQMVDEKGMEFSLGDATRLAETIQKKYQAMMPQQPQPHDMVNQNRPLPPEMERLRREGKIIMGKNDIEDAIVSEEK